MELALRSRRHQEPALLVEREGPDVLVVGIEEGRALAGAIEEVHLPLRRAARVEAPVRGEGERMHLELGGVVDGGARAYTLDAEHAAFVAGGGVDPALRVTGEGPDRRRLRVVQRFGDRGQAD